MPDLKPCPNPECEAICPEIVGGSDGYQAICYTCLMVGPLANGSEDDKPDVEAARLWNLLPRHGHERQAHVDKPSCLTKRQRLAIEAARVMLSRDEYAGSFPEGLAFDAVRLADALIKQMEQDGGDVV